MRIGVTMFATDRAMPVHELAVAAEERGFHSLYVPEHTHIPVSRETPPPAGGDTLDEGYARVVDPLVSLAAAAAVTDRILLGTAVALPAQHDPIAWAKAVATLDRLAAGRLVLGVGFGWNREELRDHGVAFGERRAVVREHMLAAQALWRDEVAEFHGDHVHLSPSWAWPKPVQQPRPRVLVGGGAGPALFAHIAEWADGWMPIGGAGIGAELPALRQAVADAGRDPASLHVVPIGVLPGPGKLDHHRAAGVTECVLRLPSAPGDEVRRALDDAMRWLDPGGGD
ncbi:MAG: TIGR03619 family F420-dependent LLM class oxidoreductase [Actinobacteria bacterium]|nr:TIGR03619 family F420-dependent LLM class oxidoreductase [Actinomycetota bacterium]